jgi:FKBP-type peptidyl-prolyl cis-trans isomerase
MFSSKTLGAAALIFGLVSCSNTVETTDTVDPTTTVETTDMENATPHAGTTETEISTWKDGDTIPCTKDAPDIKILKVHMNGNGPVCGNGKRATLKYVAMLANGTVIDPGRRPYTFTVGRSEAIAGWDVVVAQMRVGDSFTITLPQQLAYGPSKGDLKFDMELLSFR